MKWDEFLKDNSDDKEDTDNLFDKLINNLLKENKLNLLEYTYLLNFNKTPSYINSDLFKKITNKINNKDLIDLSLEKYNIFTNKNDKLKIKKRELINNIEKENENIIKFTNDQKKAIKKILKFLPNSKRTFGLYGYAGTGKTTILSELIYFLLKHKFIKSVVFTAPTNQAVRVIKFKMKHHIKNLYQKINPQTENISFDVMLDKLDKYGYKIDFITIHKLLKFEKNFDADGELVFIRNNGDSLFSKYELVIVDECSMISMKIVEHIMKEVNLGKLKKCDSYKKIPKVIFAGDPAQLPPVNENKSVIFIKSKKDLHYNDYIKLLEQDEKYNNFGIDVNKAKYEKLIKDITNMKTITLKEVKRSRLDSVTGVCNEIRKWTIGELENPNIKQYEGQNGIYYYQYKNGDNKLKTSWFKKFLEYTINQNNSNIILTWTNYQCDIYNNAIRTLIFGKKKLNKFEIGDILILTNYYNIDDEGEKYIQDGENRFYTSDQIKVLNIEEAIYTPKNNSFSQLNKRALKLKNANIYNKIYKQFIGYIHKNTKREYKCWKLIVSKLNDENHKNKYIIYVVHNYDIEKLNQDKEYADVAIKRIKQILNGKFRELTNQIDTNIINQCWKDYHRIYIEPYANISYGYAITVHKAQGSNCFNVFVDINDIGKNNKETETKQCIYTAMTRTTNELHLLL